MNHKVMVAGHICLDIAPRFGQALTGGLGDILRPGKLINIGDAVISTGGPVSNTGLAMAKLGIDVLLNSKVGDDGFGSLVKQLVGADRASAFSTVPGEHTSYTIILAMPGIDRIFLHSTGANDTFTADDVDYASAGKCVLFHFGYPPLMKRMYQDNGAQLVDMFKRLKRLGVTTSLDMSLPDPSSESGAVAWQDILERTLPFVDIFVPSIEEIAFMLNRPLFERCKAKAGGADAVFAYEPADYTALSQRLLEMGAKIIALKSGIRGLYLRTASAEKIEKTGKACPDDVEAWSDRQMWAASFRADEFGSATGAGDATIAGFLCGLIRGFSPEDSLQIANTVGWQNVRAIDALSGIEDWNCTLRMLKQKTRVRNPLELEQYDGWTYSRGHQIFYGPCDARK